jgi:hypothetical protein
MRFCLQSSLFSGMAEFMAAHSAQLSSASAPQCDYSLQSKALHTEFIASFEKQLTDFIQSQGCSVQDFFSLCRAASETERGDALLLPFIDFLERLTDFEAFMDMSRDEAKRKYVQQILTAYAGLMDAE